jgi:hypothetical protein
VGGALILRGLGGGQVWMIVVRWTLCGARNT